MQQNVVRRTVDLFAYPDLVVIYLGMRVNRPAGVRTLLGFGPKISDAAGRQPSGLLLHEQVVYSLIPPHVGMRQYWRDFESLERWARSEPHRVWWQMYLRDTGGTGFWHETYFMRGGFEAVYDEMPRPIGLATFATIGAPRGSMFSARNRLHLSGEAEQPPALTEDVLSS